jgi:ABC-2 type transport system permease protein
MFKTWLVAQREYMYNLKRPSFLFSAFGTPIMIVGIWILIFAFNSGGESDEVMLPVYGMVDQAGVLLDEEPRTMAFDPDDEGNVESYEYVPYASEDAARAALDAEEINGYYVISADYYQTALVERYSYTDSVPGGADALFRRLLIMSLTDDVDIDDKLIERVYDTVGEMQVTLLDSGRELSQNALPVLLLTPMFFGIIFFMAAQTTSSFLMNGLVEEKKNHIMELVVTTITPMQLLLGKVLGLGLLGLTQALVWVFVIIFAFIVGPQFEALSVLGDVDLPFDLLIIGLIYFVLGYFLIASMLSVVGVLAGSEQQSNQYTLIVMIPTYFIPIFSAVSFIENVNGPLPVALSIIPLTSPLSMILRVGFGAVPLWQIALSMGLLLLTSIIMAWLAARIFRWGLLLYGKKIRPRDILNAMLRRENEMQTVNMHPETIKEDA